ncbi:hypothetical protein G7046_g211 [Stylonectria norvegica]|nr:hypothetical protein G7046_g211 [Stylonectria norvegica]
MRLILRNFVALVASFSAATGVTSSPAPLAEARAAATLADSQSLSMPATSDVVVMGRDTCSGAKTPPKFVMRILPLGASITWGTDSSDNNGYRENLRDLIMNAGATVNYVGSKQNGNIADNDVEAKPGDRIDQIALKAEASLPYLLNLVVIHAGTNDCLQAYDPANAHLRMGALIDRILSAVKGSTVLISTMIPNLNSEAETCIQMVNANLLSMRITVDGTHPPDEGYVKMTNGWFPGIQAIWAACALSEPLDNTLSDSVAPAKSSTTCEKIPGSNDGLYEHPANQLGKLNVPVTVSDGSNNQGVHTSDGFFWADIDGDGLDDYVWVGNNTVMGVALNTGISSDGKTVNFGEYVEFDQPGLCYLRGVRFGDINADGRADFFCLGLEGELHAWQNTPGSSPGIPKHWCDRGTLDLDGRTVGGIATGIKNGGHNLPAGFKNFGQVKFSEGADRANVRFEDVNGDGRADYVWLNKVDGSFQYWANEGPTPAGGSSFTWVPKGIGAEGQIARGGCINFGNLKGLGRADYIEIVPTTCVANTWFNLCPAGTGGSGSAPIPVLPALPGSPGLFTGGASPTSTTPSTTGGSTPTSTGVRIGDPSYTPGARITYRMPADNDIGLIMEILGSPATFLPASCSGTVVAGDTTGALECIQEAVKLLMLEIYTTDTSTTKRRSLSSGHRFELHPKWLSSENGTKTHKSLTSVPQSTWTPLGTAILNGTSHDIHFVHTDRIFGYRRHFEGYPGNSSLSSNSSDARSNGKRSFHNYEDLRRGIPWVVDYYTDTSQHLDYDSCLSWYKPAADVSEFLAESLTDTISLTGYPQACIGLTVNGTPKNVGYMTFGQNEEALAISLENTENQFDDCDKELYKPMKSGIYPVDGLKTDGAQTLLESFGTQANLENYDSQLDDIGILFWTIGLTEGEVETVRSHIQVRNHFVFVWADLTWQVLDVVLLCIDDCEDPSVSTTQFGGSAPAPGMAKRDFDRECYQKNTADDLEKRDFGTITDTPRDLSLTFILQAYGHPLTDSNKHDETAGQGVLFYILEKSYDISHSEFNTAYPGFSTLHSKIESLYAVGPVVSDPTGHGTCMLDVAAGYLLGVSPNLVPRLFMADYVRDKIYFVDFLTHILRDYRANKARTKTVMDKLVKEGMLIVAAAGNYDWANTVNYPASTADPNSPSEYHVDGVLVVDAVDYNGNILTGRTQKENGHDIALGSNWVNWGGDDSMVFAPGADTLCAGPGSTGWIAATGTSAATARAAGLAAQFIGLSSLAPNFAASTKKEQVKKLKSYIIQYSWARPGQNALALGYI